MVPDPGSPDGFHHWILGGSHHWIRHPQSIPVPDPGSGVSFVALSPGVTVTESRWCHCLPVSPRSGVSRTGVTVTQCHRNPVVSPLPHRHRHRAMRRHLNDTVRRRLDAAGCGRRGRLLPADHRRLCCAGRAVCRDGGSVPVTPCRLCRAGYDVRSGAGCAVPVVPCGAGCASPAVPPREVLPGPAGPVVPGPVSEPVGRAPRWEITGSPRPGLGTRGDAGTWGWGTWDTRVGHGGLGGLGDIGVGDVGTLGWGTWGL